MRAIEITSFGGPEVLQVCERPVPVPQAGEVLIKVAAAGVNRPDVLQRLGKYPVPPGASDLPGLEVAGEIVAGDVADSGFHLGDKVCALAPGGGYAEYCAVPAAHCLPIPEGLSLIEAASLPETYFTVWSNLFDQGSLHAGETVLIHGGSSGIGVTAIQLAKAFGATVYVTAGSAAKCQACLALGADAAINYHEQDFSQQVGHLTTGRGVNVILDMVGGDYIPRNVEALAADGRLLQIALLHGGRVEINFASVLLKRLMLRGSTLRPRSIVFKAAIAQQLQKRVWPLFATRQIKPVIDSTYPLAQAANAHRRMEAGQHIGKIVLTLTQ
ncbi:MAG: NAD(P)H-quinone oxidoreductase [Burkholderiaceae bacterium]|nr:MAG: NAD(P)H-quinone oxidoreductase [Burkholderiaceae bacterium]